MPRRSGLADAIHYLKLSFAKRLRSQRSPEKSGGFWQKRYYDRNVRSYREFVVKLRYLHRNPVKRGLVSNLQDWKWSNYRHYGFREIAIVVIESEWTARDREQKERWRSASNFPSPWLGPKIGANLGHLARLIGDKAYDSDRLDRELAERYGIEMIAPHRGERRRRRKMVALWVATADVGESNDFSPGCIIFGGS